MSENQAVYNSKAVVKNNKQRWSYKYSFFVNDKCVLRLKDSEFYSNRKRFKWCADKLFEIGELLRQGNKLKIVGKNTESEITTDSDLINWIKAVYNSETVNQFDLFVREVC